MESKEHRGNPNCDYDIVVLGGSFSGSTLSLLLRRSHPNARILVLEKSAEFSRRVGESTSEVAGCFLTRVLGLSNYLGREHFPKHGLRLWFNEEGNQDPASCSEIGPMSQTRLPTYQLDRSQLDQHLLDLAATEGCEVVREAKVLDLHLGGAGENTVRYCKDGEDVAVRAGWVADCSGRVSLIARQRGTMEANEAHPVHSIWVRFQNVRSLDSDAVFREAPFLRENSLVGRGSATNHLMGHGWWSWVIPLANGDVSAGVTWDERLFEPAPATTVGDRVKQTLLGHPIGRLMFEHAVPVEGDARSLKNLAYHSTEVCGDGWASVGDAAGFMDPLYSQGLDYCAHGAFATAKLLGQALDGTLESDDLSRHDQQFQESYDRWFHAVYENKYQYMGDADLMRAAFFLDIGCYFIGPVQLVYRLTDQEFANMPYAGRIGAGVARFMTFYNRRLERIARKRLQAGTYGKNNLLRRDLISRSFSPGLGGVPHVIRGFFLWMRLELETARQSPGDTLPTPEASAATS
jgi:flavin-dependent dehydrogenase